MKITTLHGDCVGLTSLKRALRYVKSGRATWEGDGRIRFKAEDARNVSAARSMEAVADIRRYSDGLMPVRDMRVATQKEMRGVPILSPEKLLYKMPGEKKLKPMPVVVLRRNGLTPGDSQPAA